MQIRPQAVADAFLEHAPGLTRYGNYCDLVARVAVSRASTSCVPIRFSKEHGFRPRTVAGTSAGAITAALIAAGYSTAELKDAIFGLDFLRFRDTGREDKAPLADKGISILMDPHERKGGPASSQTIGPE